MSEAVYQQVEDAISRNLYVPSGTRVAGTSAWWRPIKIDLGHIIMLWGDCGREDRPEDLSLWTPERWRDVVSEDGRGLYRKVGLWSFWPAFNPAIDEVLFANRHPDSAGLELHRLKKEVAELRRKVEATGESECQKTT